MLPSPLKMGTPYSFCIRFSGIVVRFTLPTNLILPECFTALMCEDEGLCDAEYTIRLLHSPLSPEGEPVYDDGNICIYFSDKGCLRLYPALTEKDGCQVACLLSKDHKHTLYYPASVWAQHRKYWHVTHLMWGELMLLWQDAFLLHSSVVQINGKAVLFSGPSGAGKSTQAKLWQEHLGADILNGDRTVVMRKNGTFYGGGSPWSGTSGIFRSEQAPIAGIFILKKGSENRIRPLGAEAFLPLFSQTTLNSWDKEFMTTVTEMYGELLEKIPVWELQCTLSTDAADLAYNTLFTKEDSR